VEGQQEVQLLLLDAATGELALLQKLALPGVANPAAVTFDASGRLWVAGGVLARDTQSAHVGVAARTPAGGTAAEFEDVTASVLPEAARAALEQRVESEEQQAAAAAAEGSSGYYFASLRKAVYLVEEVSCVRVACVCVLVGPDRCRQDNITDGCACVHALHQPTQGTTEQRKRGRRDLRDIDRLRALAAAQDAQKAQDAGGGSGGGDQQQHEQEVANAAAADVSG
jgi:hypothetical protein